MRNTLSIAALLAGTALGLSLAFTPAQAADPVIIGAAIAQSGGVAPYDEGPAEAMEVAVDEINAKGGLLGRPIKIIYADTKSDIAYGATAAQEVIDKGAQMVVVTCDYDFGSAAASVADSAGLIAFSTCAGDPKFGPSGIGPNAFTMATGAPGQAVAMAEWAYNVKGWRSGYVLLDTTIAFDATWADFFKRRWAELAGADALVGEDTFGGEDPQIASQITRIKAWPSSPTSSCWLLPARRRQRHAPAARGRRQPAAARLRILGRRLSGSKAVPNLTDFYFVTYGSVFGNDPRPAVADFMEKFQAKWNKAPVTSHAITGYSVIEAWTRAVERAGTFDTDKVREALQKFKDEPLLAGPTTYTEDEHINMQRDLLLMQVKDGKTGNIIEVVRAEKMPNIAGHSGARAAQWTDASRWDEAAGIGTHRSPTSSSNFQGLRAHRPRQPDAGPRRDPRPDRAERRGQDDAGQCADRASSKWTHGEVHLGGDRHRARWKPHRTQPARPGPDISERSSFRRTDSAGECRGRRAWRRALAARGAQGRSRRSARLRSGWPTRRIATCRNIALWRGTARRHRPRHRNEAAVPPDGRAGGGPQRCRVRGAETVIQPHPQRDRLRHTADRAPHVSGVLPVRPHPGAAARGDDRHRHARPRSARMKVRARLSRR